jgi:hypothetical protein
MQLRHLFFTFISSPCHSGPLDFFLIIPILLYCSYMCTNITYVLLCLITRAWYCSLRYCRRWATFPIISSPATPRSPQVNASLPKAGLTPNWRKCWSC